MKCPHGGKEIHEMGLSVSEVLHDKKIPEATKDLIIPLIQRIKGWEREIAGNIELAYRRGEQKGIGK